jgi:glyoxylase-like metal-dependent hydrolase (beta-lactamase superfamily II)
MTVQPSAIHGAALLVIGLACVTVTGAQQPSSEASAVVRSNLRARQVLAKSVAALGGEAALRGIKTVVLEERGKVFEIHQSPGALRPWREYARREVLQIDLQGGRGTNEVQGDSAGFPNNNRTIVQDGKIVVLDFRAGVSRPPANLTGAAFGPQRRNVPPLLLLEALDRLNTLRTVGDERREGRTISVVSFAAADGQNFALGIDASSGLPFSLGTFGADPIEDGGTTETRFLDYKKQGAWMLPNRRLVVRGNDVAFDMQASRFIIDGPLDESRFTIPTGLRPLAAAAAPPASAPPLLGQGLHHVRYAGFSVLLVEFDTFFTVVEAPETLPASHVAAVVMETARKIAPNKPIRYVTFTHQHTDHAGGIRDYVAEGVTVVTTPVLKPFVEQVSSRKFTLFPDALTKKMMAPKIQVIANGRHVIEEGQQRIELYDVGPYSHVPSELLVYVPRAKLIFEGDLSPSFGPGPLVAASDGAVLLQQKIKELGIDVANIIGVHVGRLRTMAELDESVALRQQMPKPSSQ